MTYSHAVTSIEPMHPTSNRSGSVILKTQVQRSGIIQQAASWSGFTAMHAAAAHGHVSVLGALLAAGAAVNAATSNQVMPAAQNGRLCMSFRPRQAAAPSASEQAALYAVYTRMLCQAGSVSGPSALQISAALRHGGSDPSKS